MASPALPPFESTDRPYANVMLLRSCGLSLRKCTTSEGPRPLSGEEHSPDQFKEFTVPFDCEADYIAFADMFVEFVTARSDSPNRNLLHGFFDRDAVRAVSIETLTTSETTAAIQFVACKTANCVINKSLYHDTRAPRVGVGVGGVTLSATFPMTYDAEKVRFASAFAKNRLRDFYAKGVTVHVTTLGRMVPRPGAEAEAEAEVEAEAEADTEDEEDEEEEAETSTGRKNLQVVSDVLFDLKEAMSDDAFLRLSNSLKRAHDQM